MKRPSLAPVSRFYLQTLTLSVANSIFVPKTPVGSIDFSSLP